MKPIADVTPKQPDSLPLQAGSDQAKNEVHTHKSSGGSENISSNEQNKKLKADLLSVVSSSNSTVSSSSASSAATTQPVSTNVNATNSDPAAPQSASNSNQAVAAIPKRVFTPLISPKTIAITMTPNWNQVQLMTSCPVSLHVVLGPEGTSLNDAKWCFEFNLYAESQEKASVAKTNEKVIPKNDRALLWYADKPYGQYGNVVKADGCRLSSTDDLKTISVILRTSNSETNPNALIYVPSQHYVNPIDPSRPPYESSAYLKVIQSRNYYLNITFDKGSRIAELVGFQGWRPRIYIRLKQAQLLENVYKDFSTQQQYELFNFKAEWLKEIEVPQDEGEKKLSTELQNQQFSNLKDSRSASVHVQTATAAAAQGDGLISAAAVDDIALQKLKIELERNRAKHNALKLIISQIKEATICTICYEPATLPRVLGACGHITCTKCLQKIDENIFKAISSLKGKGYSLAQIRRDLLERAYPCCRYPIMAAGFPVLPLKEIASLFQNARTESNSASKTKETKEAKEDGLIEALRLDYYGKLQVALVSVPEVVTRISTDQWRTGVEIMFDSAVSRVFFETYARTLQGLIRGGNVTVKAAQRMLTVGLPEKNKNSAEDAKIKKEPHLVVDVMLDGKYTMRTATASETVSREVVSEAAGRDVASASSGWENFDASTLSISALRSAITPMGDQTTNADLNLSHSVLPQCSTDVLATLSNASPSTIWVASAYGRPSTVVTASFASIQQTQTEVDRLTTQNNALESSLKRVQEALICSICNEIPFLPKVLGSCGHITCEQCLKQLDDVAFESLTASGASARQHLLSRRCPLCRHLIVGAGFPVLPLREIAAILYKHGYIQADSAVPRAQFIVPNYEKETAVQRKIAALQLGCYTQSQLATRSVEDVITKITAEQWKTGVYILFESTSGVFFEAFAYALDGKGGVTVLVNASQRMLAVQLIEKNKDSAEAAKTKNEPHLLIKVAADGQFTIEVAPVPAVKASEGSTANAAATSSATANSSSASAAASPAILFTGPAAATSSAAVSASSSSGTASSTTMSLSSISASADPSPTTLVTGPAAAPPQNSNPNVTPNHTL